MKTDVSILIALIGSCGAWQSSAAGQTAPSLPPTAPVHEVVETYFGHEVRDPYRYMEEGTPEGSEWIRRQADYSETVLAALPERNRLRERLRELDQQLGARFQWVTPLPHNGYLYSKSSPSDDVYKLYLRRGLTGPERLLVDPERYRKPNGPPATLQAVYQSRDGRLVAYSVSAGNSERATLHVLASNTGRDIEKPIENVLRFASIDWPEDARSFFYRRLPPLAAGAPQGDRYLNSALYRHVVGQDSAKDRLIIGPSQDAPLQIESTHWPSVNLPSGSRWQELGPNSPGITDCPERLRQGRGGSREHVSSKGNRPRPEISGASAAERSRCGAETNQRGRVWPMPQLRAGD